jgi:N-acetylmuramoyl-L-alanine amidase
LPRQAPPPPPAVSDDFSNRLSSALSRAKGDPATSTAPGTGAQPGGSPDTGPVGQGDYIVREGDCISSIAREHGFFWQTIWDDPGNTQIVEIRKDPNVLLAEDRVTIPEKQRKDEPIAAEQRHRFKRKGEPSRLNMQFMSNGEPIANKPYKLEIDGHEPIEGMTDSAGYVRTAIPGDADRAVLTLGDPGEEVTYDLELGAMAPITELKGVQRRLRNLGYAIDKADGKPSETTTRALTEFQAANGLPETGAPDPATRSKLQQVYGG